MLEPGSRLRRGLDRGRGRCSSLYGAFSAASTLSLSSLRTTLAEHEDFHKGLALALHEPARSRRELRRCPLLSLPEQQADPGRALDPRQRRPARHRRAQPGARRRRAAARTRSSSASRAGSVAVYPLGSAVFVEAIVDVGDEPRDQMPLTGFRRIYTSRYYAVYGNC